MEDSGQTIEQGDWVRWYTDSASGRVYLVHQVLIGGYVMLAGMPLSVDERCLIIVRKNNKPE